MNALVGTFSPLYMVYSFFYFFKPLGKETVLLTYLIKPFQNSLFLEFIDVNKFKNGTFVKFIFIKCIINK